MPFWAAFPIAFAVGLLAERLGWLRQGAAWAAAIVGGTPLWLGGLPAALAVMFFVATGSLASRLNRQSPDHGGRTALQVLANGLPAAIGLALGWPAFFIGALATAAADTLATELGSTHAQHAWHPLKGRVKPGTNAALTWPGTLASCAGALLFIPWALAVGASPLSALAGVVGSLADTLLGLAEDQVEGWSNDLTNLLATTAGGMVALLA
jgi:uncharacterized protein (TIGR00297 family)